MFAFKFVNIKENQFTYLKIMNKGLTRFQDQYSEGVLKYFK